MLAWPPGSRHHVPGRRGRTRSAQRDGTPIVLPRLRRVSSARKLTSRSAQRSRTAPWPHHGRRIAADGECPRNARAYPTPARKRGARTSWASEWSARARRSLLDHARTAHRQQPPAARQPGCRRWRANGAHRGKRCKRSAAVGKASGGGRAVKTPRVAAREPAHSSSAARDARRANLPGCARDVYAHRAAARCPARQVGQSRRAASTQARGCRRTE